MSHVPREGAPAREGAARPASVHGIVLLAAAAFCAAATMRVADPMLPRIAIDLDTTVGTASVVTTAFALSYGLCQLVWGPFGDRWGKVRLIAIAMTISAVAVAATALSDSLATLAFTRLLAGAASAAIIPLAMAHVGDVVAYEHRQPVLAKFLSGQILGVVFGQAAGGVLIDWLGWREAFLVLGGAFAFVALLLWLELARGRMPTGRDPTPMRVGTIARRYLAIMAAPGPRGVLAAVTIEGALFFGGLAYIGAYVRHTFGIDYTTVGLLLACFGVGGLVYAATARHFVALLGQRGMVRLGAALLLLSFVGLPWLPSWPLLVPAIGVVGLGFYLFHNTLQTHATQMAPEARGSAVSLFAFVFFLGQALGVAAFGAMVDRVGYTTPFVIAGVGLVLLGAWFSRRVAGRQTSGGTS